MTDAELGLLKASVDEVVLLQIGDKNVLANILFVFDEGKTPDVFYLEMQRTHDGSLLPVGQSGHSTLLSEISAVSPVPES